MSQAICITRLTPIKRGRKYFECSIPEKQYTAKLIIDEITGDLSLNQSIAVRAEDHSRHTNYGSTVIYKALSIVSSQDHEKLTKIQGFVRELDRWMKYASRDIEDGRFSSNAIHTVNDMMHRMGANLSDAEQTEIRARWQSAETKCAANAEAHRMQKRAWEAERIEREQERKTLRARRRLYPVSDLPKMGVAVSSGGGAIVFESTGKHFCIDNNAPSIHGSHLLGYEGDLGCYVYFRPATEDEMLAAGYLDEVAGSQHAALRARTDDAAAASTARRL